MDVLSRISELERQLEALLKLLSAKVSREAELEAEIARLTLLLSQKEVKKNSSNSHQSPSSDLGRKNQSLREKSDKPVGGQIGHEGHTLKMSASPDKVEDLRPAYCGQCGGSLSGMAETVVSKRQVIDLPPIVPITTEYRQIRIQCRCGHCTQGAYPAGVTNHVQYGSRIQSIVVYMSTFQFIPFKRLQDCMTSVLGVPMSKGTIENILRRAANNAAPAYEAIKKRVQMATTVGADETGGHANGGKLWFWVWQNRFLTYIVAASTRAKQVITDTFPDGLPNAVLVTDRLAAQLATVSKGKQLCLAHLLRDLNYLILKEQTQWATDFLVLLKQAIHLKHLQSHYAPDHLEVVKIEQTATALLAKTPQVLGWDAENNPKTAVFLRAMITRRDALFLFLYYPDVPPDNNGSERAIRLIKIKTKVSGQFKSLQQPFAVLRSVIDTATKNGMDVFDAINAVVDCHPQIQAAG